jgi:DNA-binding NarL/FixJ family response regulator
MTTIRVFVADDHELVRFALRTMLQAEEDIEVVGEGSDSQTTIDGCESMKPDVLVLDLRMPGEGGVGVCKRVRECCPDTRVLILTSFDEDEELFGALAAGACGYLLKGIRPERIVHAIRAIADGQSIFDSAVADRIILGRPNQADGMDAPLSEREMQVLGLMAQGMSNKEIGKSLWICETTVKTHVSNVLHKLGQADRTQAVLAAVRSGLVDLG